MSTKLPTPEPSIPGTPSASSSQSARSSKPQRVLACVSCQQRKLKCDRKFPCINCLKSRAICVPATLAPRQRRRQFPERELLGRLRKYEDLLQQNNIAFEPLHRDLNGEEDTSGAKSAYDMDDGQPEAVGANEPSSSTTNPHERGFEAKNIWRAINQGKPNKVRDRDNDSDSSHDDVQETVIRKAWDSSFDNDDHLLFGSRKTTVNLSTLHPEPVQIFRLWQIYLDNINPLLKITHTPSLQRRIIETASNMNSISPIFEALIFSIYCMSVLSLDEEDLQKLFGSSKEDLLRRYQFGCQQALLNCGFLRSSDRDCLTALYLYLISIKPSTNPQSLSSLLAIAVRIAQRMGIHSESALAKHAALEAEMRRRLWWSLALFDARIGELAGYKTATLAPTWDCRVPLNVDDSDLRPEMREPPAVQGKPTEAIFAVVRGELGEFIRYTRFHLNFTNPALKPIAKHVQQSPIPEGGELVKLEKMVEDTYLNLCNPENPLHFMTIWTTRAHLARCRLMEHYSRFSSSTLGPTEAQRDAANSHALSMLVCDTKIMTSPLTKGYIWLLHWYFPFLAYIQIVQDMSRRPIGEQANQAWEVMSDNYDAHPALPDRNNSPLFKVFTSFILKAWQARQAAQPNQNTVPPRIVTHIQRKLAQNAQRTDSEQASEVTDMSIDDLASSISTGFDSNSLFYSMGEQDYARLGQGGYLNTPGDIPLDNGFDRIGWPAMDWDLVVDPTTESSGLSLPRQEFEPVATQSSWIYGRSNA